MVGILGASGTGLGVAVNQYEPVLAEGSIVGVVPVGGLSPEAATKRVRLWWESERTKKTIFKSSVLSELPPTQRWDHIGLGVDDIESIAQVPLQDFWASSQFRVNLKQPAKTVYPVVFVVADDKVAALSDFVRERQPAKGSARAVWSKGAVVRTPERPGLKLNDEGYRAEIVSAFQESRAIDIPLTEGDKRIPDAELNKIQNSMAAYSTRFSAGNRPRSSNIALAARKINGFVLMPGEKFSFNGVVGPRTLKAGYRIAGVLVQGRLDEGVGGGICQVSTTLYNAALLANLKMIERKNHSSSVPYVPIGRDCAVSYGQLDLVIENTMPHPVAFASSVGAGTIEFRVLGIKVPGQEVTIERSRAQSWSRGVKYEHDPSLPYGRVRLVDKGGTAHKVTTWRVVKVNGKVVKREALGESYYPGAPRLLAKNMRAKPPAAATPATTAPAQNESTPAPSPVDADN